MLASHPHQLSFDLFTLDTVRCVLLRGAVELPLRRQSFEVLQYLAEHAGQVVSNDELIDAVWTSKPADYASSVGQCIKEIRQAIGSDSRWIIKTISGRGYQFQAEVVKREASRPHVPAVPKRAENLNAPLRRLVEGSAAGSRFQARRPSSWVVAAIGMMCVAIVATYLPGRLTAVINEGHRQVAIAEAGHRSSTSASPEPLDRGPVTELFADVDARRIAELAQRKQLPIPSFHIHTPGHDVPGDYRRFVGIWVSNTGWVGSNRQYMLVITDVTKEGLAAGYYVVGPPQPGSRAQSPPHFAEIKGHVKDASFFYEDPTGKYASRLTAHGQIELTMTVQNGIYGWVTLDPAWTLVEAEGANPIAHASADRR